MEETSASFGQLASLSKRVVRRLMNAGENRLELLLLELQEERQHLLHAFLLALAVAALGLLSGIAFSAAVVVILWPYSPAGALIALTFLYGGTGVWLCRRLNCLLKGQEAFAASLSQLRKDRACLDGNLS